MRPTKAHPHYHWFAIFAVGLLISCSTQEMHRHADMQAFAGSTEVEIGQANYRSLQQISGGVYHADPELNQYISEIGTKIAAFSDRPMLPYTFSIINSSALNAWSLPGGMIGIDRGLLSILENEGELAAVLAHEIAHAAMRHNITQFEKIATIDTERSMADLLLELGPMDNPLALSYTDLSAYLDKLQYSHDQEVEAEKLSMRYLEQAGYDPDAVVSLQKKFVATLQHDQRINLKALETRIKNTEKLASAFAHNQFFGGTRYQEKIAHLKKDLPAYQFYEEGLRALKEPDLWKAQNLANKAIQLEPEEAQFYYLKGLIALNTTQYNAAIKQFSKAILRTDDYYLYYYQRGLCYEASRQWDLAKLDFESSLTLLHTREAHQALQRIAKKVQ